MKVERIQIVLEYKLDNLIVMTLGPRIKTFQEEFKVRIQELNIPQGSPPNAPRIMLSREDYIVNIGLNRADLFLTIPSQINNDFNQLLAYSYDLVEKLYTLLFEDAVEYEWVGVVTNILIPNTDIKKRKAVKILEPVFDDLININRKGRKLASFNLQYGFEENDFYKNYTINGYESININVPPIPVNGKTQQIQLKVTDDNIDESGISINIDINNRNSKVKHGFMNDYSRVMDELKGSKTSFTDETSIAF